MLICPDTGLEGAVQFAEKLRLELAESAYATPTPVTASFGVTSFYPNDTAAAIIQRVDEALYRAKHHGRNRVEAATLQLTAVVERA